MVSKSRVCLESRKKSELEKRVSQKEKWPKLHRLYKEAMALISPGFVIEVEEFCVIEHL